MSVCKLIRVHRAFSTLSPQSSRLFSTSTSALSGHNKWSKIKGVKGAMDAQRSKLHAHHYKNIILAVRENGGNPETNASLAAVLRRAKDSGIPKDSIERALKKATGVKDGLEQAITYEAMGPGSVGIIIECLTNNARRTLLFTKNILVKHGARIAPVMFLFQKRGVVRVSLEQGSDFDARLERLIETALEADAEDFEQDDEPEDNIVEVEFKCPPTALSSLTAAVTAPGLCKELVSSEMCFLPVEKPESVDEETQTTIGQLVEELEALDDTLRITTTID